MFMCVFTILIYSYMWCMLFLLYFFFSSCAGHFREFEVYENTASQNCYFFCNNFCVKLAPIYIC